MHDKRQLNSSHVIQFFNESIFMIKLKPLQKHFISSLSHGAPSNCLINVELNSTFNDYLQAMLFATIFPIIVINFAVVVVIGQFVLIITLPQFDFVNIELVVEVKNYFMHLKKFLFNSFYCFALRFFVTVYFVVEHNMLVKQRFFHFQ